MMPKTSKFFFAVSFISIFSFLKCNISQEVVQENIQKVEINLTDLTSQIATMNETVLSLIEQMASIQNENQKLVNMLLLDRINTNKEYYQRKLNIYKEGFDFIKDDSKENPNDTNNQYAATTQLKNEIQSLEDIINKLNQDINKLKTSNGRDIYERWWNLMDTSLQKSINSSIHGIEKASHTIPPDSLKANVFNIKKLRLNYQSDSDSTNLNGEHGINFSINTFYGLNFLTQLEELDLRNHKIDNLSYVGNLKNLKKLFIDNTQTTTLTPLKNLINLETLGCTNNRLEQLDGIEEMENLKWLICSENPISNINSLFKFYNNGGELRHLKISTTNLSLNKISQLKSKFNNTSGCKSLPNTQCSLRN